MRGVGASWSWAFPSLRSGRAIRCKSSSVRWRVRPVGFTLLSLTRCLALGVVVGRCAGLWRDPVGAAARSGLGRGIGAGAWCSWLYWPVIVYPL